MKYYFFSMALALTVILSGCSKISNQNMQHTNTVNKTEIQISTEPTKKSSSTQSTNIIINEQGTEENGAFYLGMTRQDLISSLKKMKIDISNEIEITSSSDAWDFGNKVLEAKGYNFEFDKEDKLYEIRVLNDIPTTLGLKQGDSLVNMEKLYGKNYTVNQIDNSVLYSYNIGNHCFWVNFENDKVGVWGIHNKDLGKSYNKQEHKTNTKNEEIESELQKITDAKVEEYREAVNKAEKEASKYNFALASIKGSVFDVLHTDDTTTKWISEKRRMINERLGSSSIIYSGISTDKIHFIALTQPKSSHDFDFTDAVNSIRGDKNEMNLLFDIDLLPHPNNYYAIDIFVDDLFNTKKEIKIDKIKFGFNDKETNFIATLTNNELDTVLNKYNRTLNYSNIVPVNAWSLYLFKSRDVSPNNIIVDVGGESIELNR